MSATKYCNAVAMVMQKSCYTWGKEMFSTFTKSATIITRGINQIYSRQTQDIIIFLCTHK